MAAVSGRSPREVDIDHSPGLDLIATLEHPMAALLTFFCRRCNPIVSARLTQIAV